ncbi:MAG: helix-turn-helix domain-containing protein [Muribaculaceae bacterium]|nr:helix-turn-helix domain-containing protein [Muribaculaceae bacterium]MBR6489351.1 helix-turn-helix domain-containing protein [Muribaculaceae bacterium]
MMDIGIQQVNINDVPKLTDGLKYYDGEIGFADDIRSVVHLSNVVKVNFVAFIFCVDGSMSLKINSNQYHLKANDGLLVDMQSVVSDINYDKLMSCKIICISVDGGVSFLSKGVLEAFLKIRENPVIHFNENEIELMSKYYELALFKMEHPEIGYNSKESMHNILRAYVLDMIASVVRHDSDIDNSIMRQSDKIFSRFIMMLSSSNGTQRSVKEYADALCVSPKYLTSICRKQEGKTASELITINTLAHIKQMLLYSSLSIKEIAMNLGFENLSFFGKYVKKHLGASPSNYRKQNSYGK